MTDARDQSPLETCQLYLITPPKIDLVTFEPAFRSAFEGGDIACVQLRLKDVSDDDVRAATKLLQPIAHDHGTAFIVNDRPDLAHELGADGCHVGQEDASYAQAREDMGEDAIVGVTCHDSKHMAMLAGEQGADYVAFGAFYPTQTKKPKSSADPEILSWWTSLFEIPCVAIGGITTANCEPLIQAGADFLAVSSGIWDFPDGPAAAVHTFNEIMRNTDLLD